MLVGRRLEFKADGCRAQAVAGVRGIARQQAVARLAVAHQQARTIAGNGLADVAEYLVGDMLHARGADDGAVEVAQQGEHVEPRFQVRCHVVERAPQFGELVVADQCDAGSQVAAREAAGKSRQLVERLHLAADLSDGERRSNGQRQQHDDRKQVAEVLQPAQRVGSRGDLHDEEARAVERRQELEPPQPHQQVFARGTPRHGGAGAVAERRLQHLAVQRSEAGRAEQGDVVGVENAVALGCGVVAPQPGGRDLAHQGLAGGRGRDQQLHRTSGGQSQDALAARQPGLLWRRQVVRRLQRGCAETEFRRRRCLADVLGGKLPQVVYAGVEQLDQAHAERLAVGAKLLVRRVQQQRADLVIDVPGHAAHGNQCGQEKLQDEASTDLAGQVNAHRRA